MIAVIFSLANVAIMELCAKGHFGQTPISFPFTLFLVSICFSIFVLVRLIKLKPKRDIDIIEASINIIIGISLAFYNIYQVNLICYVS